MLSLTEHCLFRRFRSVKNPGDRVFWPSNAGTTQRKKGILRYENIGQAKSKFLRLFEKERSHYLNTVQW